MPIRSALLLGVLVTWLPAQGDPDLEARIRELEAQASRAEALAWRVEELESRLVAYEGMEAERVLEEAVSALRAEAAAVHARKASALVLGGQMRLRAEARTVSRYQDPRPRETDEDFVIQRTRFSADARLGERIRAFLELQDSRQWGEETTVLGDLEGVDLHQGFVDFEDLFGSGFLFRAGRFELSLWNQRLISPLDWHPVARSWDGLFVSGALGEVALSAGFHILTEDPVIDSDQDTDLYWLAGTWKPAADHELGLVLLSLDADAGAAEANFQTLSLHAQGRSSGFDYALDLAGQWGRDHGRTVRAWAIAAELGHTFAADWSPRVALEWTWASGDEDPDDGRLETFNPLFPFGHAYQGHLDIFSWRNGHDLVLHLQAKPAPDWWIGLALHGFWLDESADAWYGADLLPIRSFPGASSRHVGWELDLSAKHWISGQVWLWFGYSRFFPGRFVEDSGQDPATDWVWLQLTADF
jgi:hypothetical protein